VLETSLTLIDATEGALPEHRTQLDAVQAALQAQPHQGLVVLGQLPDLGAAGRGGHSRGAQSQVRQGPTPTAQQRGSSSGHATGGGHCKFNVAAIFVNKQAQWAPGLELLTRVTRAVPAGTSELQCADTATCCSFGGAEWTHFAWELSGAVVLNDGSPLLRRPKPMPSARSMPLNVRAVPGWLSVGSVELGDTTGCMAYCSQLVPIVVRILDAVQ